MRYAIQTGWFLFVGFVLVASSLRAHAADEDLNEFSKLLTKHAETVDGLAKWPELKVSSGHAFRTNDAVYFKLDKWPADAKLSFPRLNNPTKKAYLLGKAGEEFKLKPELRHWILPLPKRQPADASLVIVLQTIGKPHLPLKPEQIHANRKGDIVLAAHKAVTHGEKLRYEPQPHKNTVGYWTNPKDWAQWHINVDKAGEYEMYILQGCGKGQGGSKVSISLKSANKNVTGSVVVRFTVKDTGHFQNFVMRRLDDVAFITTGPHTIEVRPLQLAAKAIMDVREIRLVPKKLAADE